MSTQEKNRGFVTQSLIALKNYIVNPKLTKEHKRFLKANFKQSRQEIKDLIAKYFYLKENGFYDLKDDSLRETIVRLIEINSVINLEKFEILEKYFEGKERDSLIEKEKKLADLMINYAAKQYLYHDTLTKKEETVRINGRRMYSKLEKIYYFEVLEEYLKDKKRETLDLDDQALYDVIEKYGAQRQKGDIIIFEVKDAKAAAEDIFNLTDADDSEDESIFYFKGVHKYKKTLNMKTPYRDLSYDALKKERTRLYETLEKWEEENASTSV